MIHALGKARIYWLFLCIIFSCIPLCRSANQQRECLHIEHNDFTMCGSPQPRKKDGGNGASKVGAHINNSQTYSCIHDDICNKTFQITAINLLPYSDNMERGLKRMLSNCCGNCAYPRIINTLKDISYLNATVLATSDIVFPVFSRITQDKLYGFWYIPLNEIPSAYYVQKSLTKEDMLRDMLNGLLELWPLLLICLFFAAAAGIIGWSLETWKNELEFPRPFFVGAFEGFWWSFISMTTVGYGDKKPRSRVARCFSVVLILVGITIFSMLTASLTNLITAAESPRSSDIAGQKIGVLKGRVYDATVIAKHGGTLHVVESDDLIGGINKLNDILFSTSKIISGFLVDRHTYFYYCHNVIDRSNLERTVYAEKVVDNEKYSYGVLVKDEVSYHYFRKYIEYNWFSFDTCLKLRMNAMSERFNKHTTSVLFSTENGYFLPILERISIALGIMVFLGILYDLFPIVKEKIRTNKVTTKDVVRVS